MAEVDRLLLELERNLDGARISLKRQSMKETNHTDPADDDQNKKRFWAA